MVDTCSPPAPEDCGLSPLNDVLGAASSGGLWVGLAIDGADELVPRLPVGAVPFALTARDSNTLGGNPASVFEAAGAADAAVAGHAADPDAHHPADSARIHIRPSSVAVGGTSLNEGELDLGPEVDDAITAEIAQTLTGGGNADALHAHAGGSGSSSGVCYTAWGQATCGGDFTVMYSGIATFSALVETGFGAGSVSSPVCVSSTAIACTSGGISTWDESQLVAMNDGEARVTTDEDAPLSCAICCR